MKLDKWLCLPVPIGHLRECVSPALALGWGCCGEMYTVAAGDAQFITSIDQCQIYLLVLQWSIFHYIGKYHQCIETHFLWIHKFTLKMMQAWPTWSAALFSR
jgi:hypothetical protein